MKWNILHTNFKKPDWNFKMAKDSDVRKSLNFEEMGKNDIFRISNDIDITNNRHNLTLFVSPGYEYNEYHSIGDEYWLIEMVMKVGDTFIFTLIMKT